MAFRRKSGRVRSKSSSSDSDRFFGGPRLKRGSCLSGMAADVRGKASSGDGSSSGGTTVGAGAGMEVGGGV